VLAVEGLREQLEIREHAGQRGAQLVGGVRDELPLAQEHRLRLRSCAVQGLEHAVERPGQLRDLVVGLGLRDPQAGVASARDLTRRGRELGDRGHRAASQDETAEQRRARASQHAEDQEEADARNGVLHRRDRPGVLDEHRV
jgi:hypothetical protein